ncbi:MAG: DNA repair protein RecN [Bacteroidales bacterium]|nr:DNA repair protein RecN [Bacteroidales bacterium]
MLSRLQVKNYVLIDSLEIDFPEGLVIITGQTGAGKSILLGALSLVMGSKADAAMLSEGAENCVVEAEFEVGADDEELRSTLEENEVEWDEGRLIIRRVVNRSGRSRAFVNDSPVPVTVLQGISSRLVDVHSQHQTLLLSDRKFQLEILDHYAGNAALRDECAVLWHELGAMRSEMAQLDADIARIAGEREYNEAQYRQLDAAKLRAGELAELEEEQKQLANAEEIKLGLGAVEEMFTAASCEGISLDASLKEAQKQLSKVSRYIPSAAGLAERVESCRRELDDILSEVSSLNARTDLSETRLQEVEDRMSLIYGLMHKHSCTDEAQLIGCRDRLTEALFDSTRLEERRGELAGRIADTASRLDAAADRLHNAREKAAGGFAESITGSIRSLELPYAVFEVILEDIPVGAYGRDAVMFRFSATGRNAVDVAKCASGGEMSRIMLSLKAMMARFTNMPTMIFDEIDTGVSGSVADKMGSMICSMGSYMQVFAITHLPQVAAKGSAHYLVSKEIDPAASKAVSTIKKLSAEQRVLEVARMLSGSVLTDAAIANAKALLNE